MGKTRCPPRGEYGRECYNARENLSKNLTENKGDC